MESQQQLARDWKKLLRLTRGRVPLLRALDVLAEEAALSEHQALWKAVLADLDNGATFTEAIINRPETFSRSVRELVLVAERSGEWDAILEEIADGLAEGTFS
jgi:type II secretory pathway component PulF